MALKKLRIGVLTASPSVTAWQARTLEILIERNIADVAVWVEAAGIAAPPREAGLLGRAYGRFWLQRRSKMLRPARSGAGACVATVNHAGTAREALERLAEAKPDVVLNLSGATLEGIETAAAHGCWFFAGDDIEPLDAALPFMACVIRPTGCATLNLVAHGESVLETACTPAPPHSHARCVDLALETAPVLALRACSRLLRGQSVAAREESSLASQSAPTLGGKAVAAAVAVQLWRSALTPFKFIHDLMRLEIWNIAIIDRPWHEWVENPAASDLGWFPDPAPLQSVADPFAWRDGERLHLLAEAMDYRNSKATIAETTVIGTSAPKSTFRTVLERSSHLSYPALFFLDGAPHMTPESYEAGEINLFKAVPADADGPGPARHRWTHAGVVMDNIAGIDPMVFEHGGRWWLFCTDQDDGPNHKLNAWHGCSPLGPWRAHAMNPIVIDRRSARGAGPMMAFAGKLFRPGQDCSRTYGGAISLREVLRLTPDDYAEKPYRRVAPDIRGKYPDGLHTICPVGDRTLIDGKRYAVGLYSIVLKIRNGFINRKRRKELRLRRH